MSYLGFISRTIFVLSVRDLGNLSSKTRVPALTSPSLLTEPRMDKSSESSKDSATLEIDHRYQYVPSANTPIRNTFERIRTQLAQEAEQKSRPVSRLYSGFRAVKA